jgi:adenylate kinase
VVHLDVPRDVLMARLRRRRDLEGRDDDTDDVIARRLEVYEAETAPVRDAVSDWADVVTIDGDQPPDAVAEEIVGALRSDTSVRDCGHGRHPVWSGMRSLP